MRNSSFFNHTRRLRVHVQSSATHPTCLYTRPSHSTRPYLYLGQSLSMHVQSSATHPTCLKNRPSHSTRPYLCLGQGLSMQRCISSCYLDPHRQNPYVLTPPRSNLMVSFSSTTIVDSFFHPPISFGVLKPTI